MADAADVKVLSAVALQPVLSALSADFERTSGHKLAIDYGTAGAVRDRVHRGEPADLVIVTAPQVEDLVKQGKVAAKSGVIISKVGVGVAVRAGAPKPDLSSAEAFKRSLLAAKSVVYADPTRGGAAGIHLHSRSSMPPPRSALTARNSACGGCVRALPARALEPLPADLAQQPDDFLVDET